MNVRQVHKSHGAFTHGCILETEKAAGHISALWLVLLQTLLSYFPSPGSQSLCSLLVLCLHQLTTPGTPGTPGTTHASGSNEWIKMKTSHSNSSRTSLVTVVNVCTPDSSSASDSS